MENRQPAAQPQITTPKRGVYGVIRRLFRKNNKVGPLNNIQEEATQGRAGPSADGGRRISFPETTAPRRGVCRAIRHGPVPQSKNANYTTGKYYIREK